MNISLNHIGGSGDKASTIIEMTVTIDGTAITTDVVNNNGFVSGNLIELLREVADELEDHNLQKTKEQS